MLTNTREAVLLTLSETGEIRRGYRSDERDPTRLLSGSFDSSGVAMVLIN
jgi:hypothetical protein